MLHLGAVAVNAIVRASQQGTIKATSYRIARSLSVADSRRPHWLVCV
jgi:hypothetical protein